MVHPKKLEKEENRRKILELLLQSPKTFEELLRETGLSRGVIASHIKELEELEYITMEHDKKDRRKKIYKPNLDVLRKAYKIDEFAEAFDYEKPILTDEHILALKTLIEYIYSGEIDENRRKYLFKPLLAGWIEFKNDKIVITPEGWRAIMKWLPTEQLSIYFMLSEGSQYVKIDEDLKQWLVVLSALCELTIERVENLIKDDKEKFKSLVAKMKEKIKVSFESKFRKKIN